MQKLEQWTAQYLLDCEYQKGLDAKTLKAYRIDLTQFTVFMEQEDMELTLMALWCTFPACINRVVSYGG